MNIFLCAYCLFVYPLLWGDFLNHFLILNGIYLIIELECILFWYSRFKPIVRYRFCEYYQSIACLLIFLIAFKIAKVFFKFSLSPFFFYISCFCLLFEKFMFVLFPLSHLFIIIISYRSCKKFLNLFSSSGCYFKWNWFFTFFVNYP